MDIPLPLSKPKVRKNHALRVKEDDCTPHKNGEPFILVEARAVELAAELRFRRRHSVGGEDCAPEPNEVRVTIGLFSIIKLFRIVNLSVESRGFCIPEECEEISPLNPCEFFENLDFPLDIFDPPQKPEFLAGISGNIPRKKKRKEDACESDEI